MALACSMPAFGHEPAEKASSSKTIPFLSFSGGNKRGRAPHSKAFGAEGCEPDTLSRVQKPFKRRITEPGSTQRAFGEEPEEGLPSKRARTSRPAPFSEEAEELEPGDHAFNEVDSEDEGPPCDSEFGGGSESVFALGWHTMSGFQRATFWKENSDDKGAVKPKRAYDNTRRAAKASYARKASASVFQRSGLDPQRLASLFQRESCLCTLFASSVVQVWLCRWWCSIV